jgi:predicted small lipoprotein YifL
MTVRMLLAALLALAACGKVGPPSPPGPPDKITYPKTYPTQ